MGTGIKIANADIADKLYDFLKKTDSPIADKIKKTFSTKSSADAQSRQEVSDQDQYISFTEMKGSIHDTQAVPGLNDNLLWKYADETTKYILQEFKTKTGQGGEVLEIDSVEKAQELANIIHTEKTFLLSGGAVDYLYTNPDGSKRVEVKFRSDTSKESLQGKIIPYNVFNFLSDVSYSYVLSATPGRIAKKDDVTFFLITMVDFLGAWPTVTKAEYKDLPNGGFSLSWRWDKTDSSLQQAKALIEQHPTELREAINAGRRKRDLNAALISDADFKKEQDRLIGNLVDVYRVHGSMTCQNEICTYSQEVNSKFNPPTMTPVVEAAKETALYNISNLQDTRYLTRPKTTDMRIRVSATGERKVDYTSYRPAK